MFEGLVTAVRTLTVLPCPGRDAERFSDSLHWFPFVGLLLGMAEAGFAWAGAAAGWYELAALMAVAVGVLLTRGIHADGLADLADGFFGGRDREMRLRIMKDSSVGSFGAVALMLVMLLKWIAVLRLVQNGSFSLIASGVVLARLAQVILAERLPYARSEGGTANSFVNGAGKGHLFTALISSVLFVTVLSRFDPVAVPVLLIASLATATAVGVLSWRKIGGVTGDVLGAASELTEAFVWTAGALLLH
jgi:adenosylcobinamide-GDP ribazoletransferase